MDPSPGAGDGVLVNYAVSRARGPAGVRESDEKEGAHPGLYTLDYARVLPTARESTPALGHAVAGPK